MSSQRLEDVLRNLNRFGQRIETTDQKQTWRFEFDRRAYLLYFYPRGARRRGFARANPAHQEFFGLQTLQKASISSPRAIAHLSGYRLDNVPGDAVIVEAIDSAQPLDEYLLELELRAETVPHRRQVALQLRTILHQLGRAGLGYEPLSLKSFIVSGNRVYLRSGAGLRRGGLRQRQVMNLAHEASRFAGISELRRAWDLLMPGAKMPDRNPLSPALWRGFVRRAFADNENFGALRVGRWSGFFTRRTPYARRWAVSSRIEASHDDWQRIWPMLQRQIERGELPFLKRDPSGQVMCGEITLGGRTVAIIIKRPFRKFWYRYMPDLIRPARARRMWKKAWQAIVRSLPTEWPMLLMEKRVLGYVTDAVIIFERVPGVTLDKFDLNSLSADAREALFRRCGTILRRLERAGLAHYDAKSTNWIVVSDEKLGPLPIMIDLDGIRSLSWKLQGFGVRRLLRAMQRHPQYTVGDSLALCRGFAPFSPLRQQQQHGNAR